MPIISSIMISLLTVFMLLSCILHACHLASCTLTIILVTIMATIVKPLEPDMLKFLCIIPSSICIATKELPNIPHISKYYPHMHVVPFSFVVQVLTHHFKVLSTSFNSSLITYKALIEVFHPHLVITHHCQILAI